MTNKLTVAQLPLRPAQAYPAPAAAAAPAAAPGPASPVRADAIINLKVHMTYCLGKAAKLYFMATLPSTAVRNVRRDPRRTLNLPDRSNLTGRERRACRLDGCSGALRARMVAPHRRPRASTATSSAAPEHAASSALRSTASAAPTCEPGQALLHSRSVLQACALLCARVHCKRMPHPSKPKGCKCAGAASMLRPTSHTCKPTISLKLHSTCFGACKQLA